MPAQAQVKSLAGFANNLSSCAILFLERGRLVAAGPTSTQALGDAASHLIGVSLAQLPAALRDVVKEVQAKGVERMLPCVELPLPDGHKPMFRVHASCPGGKTVLVITALSNVRDFDESLRRLERLAGLGTLAATLAHEIRNSMVAVRTFVDLLREKNHDPELTELVGRELRRADSLLSQMLRFSGPGKPAEGKVSVHASLDHCLRLLHPQMEMQAIRLDRNLNAERDVVGGNEYELQQAFMNILLNAMDAIGSNGVLKVATRFVPQDQLVRVSIADTGPGIAPKDLPRLFDPFFTTKSAGTGLGLAITQQIAREHGGKVTALSCAGKGAEFLVELPSLPA